MNDDCCTGALLDCNDAGGGAGAGAGAGGGGIPQLQGDADAT